MKTVVHVSSPDPHDHHAMVDVLNLLTVDTVTASGDYVALVTNAGGVRMLLGDTAGYLEFVERIREAGVSVCACGNALRGQGWFDADLLPDVDVVPSRVGELARLQAPGYGYVEAA